MVIAHSELKARQRQERDNYPLNLGLRVHRALSWLNRAEVESEGDPDARFIFLWIAFNAAYATDIDERPEGNEQRIFNAFLEKLIGLDKQNRLGELVWNSYPHAIRVLMDNPYVFPGFWAYQKGHQSDEQWRDSFAAAKKAANHALAREDTATVLAIVLSRIYTLRNQLMHGGATWNGQANREQLRDCVNVMAQLVPAVIEIMMDNPNTLWGEVSYPVV